jgi:hypothetical protein
LRGVGRLRSPGRLLPGEASDRLVHGCCPVSTAFAVKVGRRALELLHQPPVAFPGLGGSFAGEFGPGSAALLGFNLRSGDRLG